MAVFCHPRQAEHTVPLGCEPFNEAMDLELKTTWPNPTRTAPQEICPAGYLTVLASCFVFQALVDRALPIGLSSTISPTSLVIGVFVVLVFSFSRFRTCFDMIKLVSNKSSFSIESP